ncbi:hypothetical protein [Streptomyces lasiicapitis]|uniref:Secreted protein n=1 Tax=Streptomyces lasiicapitis TaxID=1923961 RepID=A0ABQ2MVG9_9ACTN|nr:hypothetical protein [Streptomyces lasiicapitis]GGO59071.1 hypothetical protein GCM10012286_79830 [Streptomyces lasiicapitis]
MNANPDTPKSSSARWPLLAAAVCALIGLVLLLPADGPNTSPRNAAAPTRPAPIAADGTSEKTTPAPEPDTGSKAPATDDIPVPGDGPGGDHAVQHLLDRSSPTDLPRRTEKQLVALASRVWTAEITGAERSQWPAYFAEQPLRAPYRDVRIQAGIARSAGGRPDRARVRLVWAGTDPAGQAQDGRPAHVLLARHNSRWEPIR